MYIEDEVQGIQPNLERPIYEPEPEPGFENRVDEMVDDNEDRDKDKDDENEAEENHNWGDSESLVLNSQQLVDALSLCDDLLQVSQEDRGGSINNGGSKNKQPCFADYARLGTEDFKRDLEDCQKLVLDPSNIELDTPPEFRLSQLVNLHHFFLSLENSFDATRHKSQIILLCLFRNLDHRIAIWLGALERLID